MDKIYDLLKYGINSIGGAPTGVGGEKVELCGACGKPVQTIVELLGTTRLMPVMCDCRKEELRKREQYDREHKERHRFDKFRRYSIMGAVYDESTFDNWGQRDDNQTLHKICSAYCKKWPDMKNGNRGMLFHGEAGCGKSYAAFAIANEISRMGQPVMVISASSIMKIIMEGYHAGNYSSSAIDTIDEIEILNAIRDASLLVLDDLGVETKTAWAFEKLYSIINTRYTVKKPIIITTNLTVDGLSANLAVVDLRNGIKDPANKIYSRISEMCAFINVAGESWRIQKVKNNRRELFRELGLLNDKMINFPQNKGVNE